MHFVSGTSFGISITTDESGRPSVTKVVPGSAADAQGCKVGNALMQKNPTQRLSPSEAIGHPWITSKSEVHQGESGPEYTCAYDDFTAERQQLHTHIVERMLTSAEILPRRADALTRGQWRAALVAAGAVRCARI